MKPIVSVVMPSYNSGRFIANSVASALKQTLRELELIVVDNGSSDETLAVVQRIHDTRLRILVQPVRGVSAARNMGIAAAHGEFIAFLDADDTWAPTCLEELHAALASRHDAALAYCGWQNVGLPGPRGLPYVPPAYEHRDKRATLFCSCPWPIHAALVRRDAVVAAGGFDITLTSSEDFALWLELALLYPLVRVPRVLAYYHFHSASQASRNPVTAALEHLRAQTGYLRRHPEFVAKLGRARCRELTLGELLTRGLECYWRRELVAARTLFREVLKRGYGMPRHYKYLLPALLPYSIHKAILRSTGRL